jgi:hypothetical protein
MEVVEAMKPKVTAVLLSWKRKENMPLIIDALRKQTTPVEVWVINNDGSEDFGADRLISIPWNAGEWARYVQSFARSQPGWSRPWFDAGTPSC